VECPGAAPNITLAPGATLTCPWSKELPGTSWAPAVVTGYAVTTGVVQLRTQPATLAFTSTGSSSSSSKGIELGRCAIITDTFVQGPLRRQPRLAIGPRAPKAGAGVPVCNSASFTFTGVFGPYTRNDCGSFQVLRQLRAAPLGSEQRPVSRSDFLFLEIKGCEPAPTPVFQAEPEETPSPSPSPAAPAGPPVWVFPNTWPSAPADGSKGPSSAWGNPIFSPGAFTPTPTPTPGAPAAPTPVTPAPIPTGPVSGNPQYTYVYEYGTYTGRKLRRSAGRRALAAKGGSSSAGQRRLQHMQPLGQQQQQQVMVGGAAAAAAGEEGVPAPFSGTQKVTHIKEQAAAAIASSYAQAVAAAGVQPGAAAAAVGGGDEGTQGLPAGNWDTTSVDPSAAAAAAGGVALGPSSDLVPSLDSNAEVTAGDTPPASSPAAPAAAAAVTGVVPEGSEDWEPVHDAWLLSPVEEAEWASLPPSSSSSSTDHSGLGSGIGAGGALFEVASIPWQQQLMPHLQPPVVNPLGKAAYSSPAAAGAGVDQGLTVQDVDPVLQGLATALGLPGLDGSNLPIRSLLSASKAWGSVAVSGVGVSAVTSYTWGVEVTTTPRRLQVAAGRSAEVEVGISVSRGQPTNTIMLSGQVQLTNSGTKQLTLTSAFVEVPNVSGAASAWAAVQCPGSTSSTILVPGSGTLTCTFSMPWRQPPSAAVALVARAISSTGVELTSQPVIVSRSRAQPVVAGTCAVVTDSWLEGVEGSQQLLGQRQVVVKPGQTRVPVQTLCASKQWSYKVQVGPYPSSACGSFQVRAGASWLKCMALKWPDCMA
jgi:hypothetical protein